MFWKRSGGRGRLLCCCHPALVALQNPSDPEGRTPHTLGTPRQPRKVPGDEGDVSEQHRTGAEVAQRAKGGWQWEPPGPAHPRAGFVPSGCSRGVTDGSCASSPRFCPRSPWSLSLFPALVTQSSQVAEPMEKQRAANASGQVFFLFWCQIGPLTAEPPLRAAGISRCL